MPKNPKTAHGAQQKKIQSCPWLIFQKKVKNQQRSFASRSWIHETASDFFLLTSAPSTIQKTRLSERRASINI